MEKRYLNIYHQNLPATGEHFLQLASNQTDTDEDNILDVLGFHLEGCNASEDIAAELPDFDSANVVSLASGDMGPLVKEELRYSILRRCVSQGKGVVKAEYKTLAEEKLSAEEEKRRDERREKNKMAARKCRNKKKEIIQELTKRNNDLQSKVTSLRYEIRKLEQEKKKIQNTLDIHLAHCTQALR